MIILFINNDDFDDDDANDDHNFDDDAFDNVNGNADESITGQNTLVRDIKISNIIRFMTTPPTPNPPIKDVSSSFHFKNCSPPLDIQESIAWTKVMTHGHIPLNALLDILIR